MIKNHHQAYDVIKSNSLNYQLIHIVKAASIFAHALGLGHGKGFSKYKAKNLEASREAFSELGIPASEDKTLLGNFARTFETEFDLYSGKGANT